MRRHAIVWRVAAAAALLGVGLSCFSDHDAGTDPVDTGGCVVNGPLPITDSTHVLVIIRDFEFSPEVVQVPPGGTVTWLNCEREENANESHTTTSTDDESWDSGFMDVGDHFSREFGTAGTFDYFCEPHPFMVGRVVVQ